LEAAEKNKMASQQKERQRDASRLAPRPGTSAASRWWIMLKILSLKKL
jgi:hypothetical protein